jgi:DNA-binding FrmR family transcriptional regulator
MQTQPKEKKMLLLHLQTLICHLISIYIMIESGRTNHAVGMQMCAVAKSSEKLKKMFNGIIVVINNGKANELLRHPVKINDKNKQEVRQMQVSMTTTPTMKLIKMTRRLEYIKTFLTGN